MKSSMTSIRVIYVHRERERKLIFKSREVNCLKECALALTPYQRDNNSEEKTERKQKGLPTYLINELVRLINE